MRRLGKLVLVLLARELSLQGLYCATTGDTPGRRTALPIVARDEIRCFRSVDATPALRRAGARGRAHCGLCTHLTPLGNRVVAEAILEKITKALPPGSGHRPSL